MLLSTNFLRDYLDLDKDIDVHELAEKMTSVGNEYDSASKFIDATNLVIGKIIECVDHPDSDHLHVCKVDVGSNVLQIVCGAPNAREGIKVIVALAGAKLPGGEIKRGSIRGVESNGMMCSIAELGIDSKFLTTADKEGIHELPEDAPIGKDPIEYLGWNDNVIDFELTANRGDLLSILGMAYEVGAIYDKKVKDIDLSYSEKGKLDFNINVKTDNCKLFLAKEVKNIKIGESPKEIKEKLMASGIRPINNVVDISNYVMIETGQPLHFYDADKLNGMLEVRMAEEGEKLVTLDNQERTLSNEDIVISNGKEAIGLAGVMGGLTTEISEETKNVVIEAAIFDSVKVRRTSNKILRSEASNRFEKGLDPNRTYMAIERACHLLEKYAEGEVLSGKEVYDVTDKEPKRIEITLSKINSILGTEIDIEDVLKCFEKLGFEYEIEPINYDDCGCGCGDDCNCDEEHEHCNCNGECDCEKDEYCVGDDCDEVEYCDDINIIVTVPTRRIDISIKEDLIEEVGRIYGVDNIEGKVMTLPIKKGSYDKTTREIRNKMVNLGLNETLSYALVNHEESSMFTNKEHESIKILSPLTEEKSELRQTLITALYKIYQYNKARSIENIALFELGKSFYKESNNEDVKYVEENKLACLMTGEYNLGLKKKNVDFYVIKGIAEEVLDYLGYEGRYSFVQNDQIPEDMHPGKSAIISVNNDSVGFIGRIHPAICKDEVYVMEINLEKLLAKKTGKMKYKEFSKFPSVKKDIAVLVDKTVTAQEMQKVIKANGGKLLLDSKVFDVYTGKGIPEGKVSIAFSVELGAQDKTLTDEEISNVMNKIAEGLQKKCSAELRK